MEHLVQAGGRLLGLTVIKISIQAVALSLAFLGPMLTAKVWPFSDRFWLLPSLLNEKAQFGQMILAAVPVCCVSFTNVANHFLSGSRAPHRQPILYASLGLEMLAMLVFLVFLMGMLGVATEPLPEVDLPVARALIWWAIGLGFAVELTLSWIEADITISRRSGSRPPVSPVGAEGVER